MICYRLLAGRANRRDLHERRSSPERDIVHPFDRDVTFQRSSVSAAVKWDIRRLAAQSQIRCYHSNHRVGTCSRMDNNRGTLIHHRETPFRPGPHPNRSECHLSGPQFIIINRLDRHHTQIYLIQLQLTLRIPSARWLCSFEIMTLWD